MFIFEGTEPSFKFQFLRALLVDVAILGLGSLIIAQVHLARKRQIETAR